MFSAGRLVEREPLPEPWRDLELTPHWLVARLVPLKREKSQRKTCPAEAGERALLTCSARRRRKGATDHQPKGSGLRQVPVASAPALTVPPSGFRLLPTGSKHAGANRPNSLQMPGASPRSDPRRRQVSVEGIAPPEGSTGKLLPHRVARQRLVAKFTGAFVMDVIN